MCFFSIYYKKEKFNLAFLTAATAKRFFVRAEVALQRFFSVIWWSDARFFENAEGIAIERLYAENIYRTTAEGVTAPFWENKGSVGELIEHGVQH